jgi:hypothetical protein
MRVYFSILLILVSVVAFSQTKEETVWAKAEALTKAIFETKDSVMLKSLVSDQVTYGHSGGAIEDKTAMITKATTSKTEYKNRQFEKISIEVKDNTAVLRHNFRAISVADGKESPLDLGILQVWRKENGRWKLWARQAVKIAPKN